VGKDSDINGRKGKMWCTRQAATGTERLARSPVLTNRDWALMVVNKGGRWCIGQATTGRK